MLRINFNEPLPSEYERQMPSGLSPLDKYNWRKHKFGELRMTGLATVDDDGNVNISSQTQVCEHDAKNDISVNESMCDDVSREESAFDKSSESSDVILQKMESQKAVSILKTPRKQKTNQVTAEADKQNLTDVESIKYVPKSVVTALRRLFPETASKADLISAAVYILTDGACEISDRAMDLVKSYSADDKLISINDRLAHLERDSKRQLMLLQSIELCTCFNTFDRRYGSNGPRKGAKLTEFREQENLDMLERLREQARDQARMDDLERGRQIYDQIKDKND